MMETMSVYSSVYPSVSLPICPSIHLSAFTSVCLSVCPVSVRLSVCPTVWEPVSPGPRALPTPGGEIKQERSRLPCPATTQADIKGPVPPTEAGVSHRPDSVQTGYRMRPGRDRHGPGGAGRA